MGQATNSGAWAVLLAAGKGTRLADVCEGPKQFLEWRGEPLYMASARTFSACAGIRGLVFVFPEDHLEAEQERLRESGGALGLPWRCVAGGARRQDSVCNALEILPEDCTRVLIHDTARPFATAALVVRVLHGLDKTEGVIPGIPVTDTIKITEAGRVVDTPQRAALRAVQTPQGFHLDVLRAGHAHAAGRDVTDDAALLEYMGRAVLVVDGEPGNRKITTPEDLAMLEPSPCAAETRVGYGYDVHRYISADVPNARPLKLGGVLIPGNASGNAQGPWCVQAHSDGDVLLHALMDALLGCIGGGDIGLLFPDSSPEFAGVNSAALLDDVLTRTRAAGLHITGVDLTVIAQKPKIAPHREVIRANVARLMNLAPERLNVKATTEEGLGFTGALEGLKAVAVVTGTL